MNRKERLREIEEPSKIVDEKCRQLSDLIRESRCTLIYTGAGLSTAASIPDYRGPNGVWTLAEQGKRLFECRDPVYSSPTKSHMALRELYKQGFIRQILSQNCDGLHLRSGLPQKTLSEVHGNMHIEVCRGCPKLRQYIRPFDVTAKSQYRRHKTGRFCDHCRNELDDTIVHFGEVGRLEWPLNWKGTTDALENDCQLIVCLGTSLTVLKQYNFLWPKTTTRNCPKLVIVNLQWTARDKVAALKIHAKCDVVLAKVLRNLQLSIPEYCRNCDPVMNCRRTARSSELMNRIAECRCKRFGMAVDSISNELTSKSQILMVTPGWWTVGINRTLKRALSNGSTHQNRGRKRCSKRRKSCSNEMIVTSEENDINTHVFSVIDYLLSQVTSRIGDDIF